MKIHREIEFDSGNITALRSPFRSDLTYRFSGLAGLGGTLLKWGPQILQVAGIGTKLFGQYQEGDSSKEIASAQAKIYEMNAKFALENATEKARIVSEEGRRLRERQVMAYAAGNIKVNTGAPLVVKAQTNADIAKDVTNIMLQGKQVSDLEKSKAALARYIGDQKKESSIWDMIGTGIEGFSGLGGFDIFSGLLGNKTSTVTSPIKGLAGSGVKTIGNPL